MKKIIMMIALMAVPFAMQAQVKFHAAEAQEAYGKVKAIKTSVMGQSQTTTFSEDGKITSPNFSDVVYNAEGYMTSAKVEIMGQKVAISYTWDGGKVIGSSVDMMGQKVVNTRTYNDKGAAEKETADMGGQKIEMPYTDYKYDEKGNWISRKSTMMGQTVEQTRTIEYYE